MDDTQIRTAAVAFARENKSTIASRIADLKKYPREKNPVSVFMAGSPGAGKTEASIRLPDQIADQNAKEDGVAKENLNVVRIDADELRLEFDAYTGENSDLFQYPTSILVDRIHDLVLKQSQSFILDGTLSNYERAEENITRSLNRDRVVQILYVYQTPEQAWKFVKQREKIEGRHIPPEAFIDQYFAARNNANELKRKFDNRIRLDLLLKNIEGTNRLYRTGIDQIDNHVPEKYSKKRYQNIY